MFDLASNILWLTLCLISPYLLHIVVLLLLCLLSVPRNVADALSQPQWKVAMQEEMVALEKNDTCDLVDLPQNKVPVGCKWVYTVKLKPDDSVDRYKARLVAKGYTQTYGIDYKETFALVAKLNSVRVLISIATNKGWPLYQFDVKNVFLHGDLAEEVYMWLPPGFLPSSSKGKVCRHKKALYGLKQSLRAWFERFHLAVLQFGYFQSHADHTLFLKRTGGATLTTLIVYVDDIIVTSNDPVEISQLKLRLTREFEIKDLGPLRYFLGIEVARSTKGICVSQRKYALDLLSEIGMTACKLIATPIDANHCFTADVGDILIDVGRYQRLVRRLIYLTITRPDIAYAVSVVSQFMHAPTTVHLDAVYHILRYLKHNPGAGLLYSRRSDLLIEGYTDADWVDSLTNSRSTSGYCTFVGGNLLTW